MNKFFAIFLSILFFCVSAFAEYQVYSYKATIKRIVKQQVKQDKQIVDTFSVVSDTLSGYLVTVCCYPCGCSFGKGYESWLFVQLKSDKERTLYKIQAQVDGGLFGRKISPEKVDEMELIYLSEDYMKYIKKASDSWFVMKNDCPLYVNYPLDPEGLLGTNNVHARLGHFGFGKAAWKMNYNNPRESRFNPYIKSINGYIVGQATYDVPFSFDPSNYGMYYNAPIQGTFTIEFNVKMTDYIRGTADWNEITRRMALKFDYDRMLETELDEDLEWDPVFQ